MMKSFGDMVKHAQKVQKQMAELQEQLKNERFEATAGGGVIKAVVNGQQMLMELKIDPAIIGGLVVKLGSRMVDSSLRTKLNAIKHAMKGVS